MSFLSKNELNTFAFEDSVIADFRIEEGRIILEIEALIVKAKNSQNANYTDSYADTAQMVFRGGKITGGEREGYRYFDANDRLIEETPAVPMSIEDLAALTKVCKGAFLNGVDAVDGGYCIQVEMPPAEMYDTGATPSYLIYVSCEEVNTSWERYLNRVGH